MTIPTLDLDGEDYKTHQREVIETLRKVSPYARNDSGYVFFNQKEAAEIFQHDDLRFSYDAHKRLRILTMKALRDRVIDELRQTIHDIVNDLILALPDKGEVDLIAEFVSPLPSKLLGPILGVPYEEVDDIDEWISISSRNIDFVNAKNEIPAIEDAWRSLENFLLELIEERRHNLGDDIFSELIKAEEGGDKMSSDELIGIASELARAGVETTRSQLAITLYQILKHPEQWKILQDNPDLAGKAVEEGMRYAPLPHVIPQQAIKDVECCGLTLHKDEIAMVLVPATNWDPVVFENPEIFDVTRTPKKHYTFGAGIHLCPGMHLARMEMSMAIEGLARQFKSIELVEQPKLGLPSQGWKPASIRVEIEKIP
jgi:cytochrome P450